MIAEPTAVPCAPNAPSGRGSYRHPNPPQKSTPDPVSSLPGALLAPSGTGTHADASRADELAATPEKSRQIVARAIAGEASPRQAIKARCLQCSHFDRAEIAACTVVRCALWRYRPYQTGSLGE